MSSCPNCGAKLSCGCQKRTLANGKTGCSNCASRVEKKPAQIATEKPTVNTNTWGPHRYLNLKKFTKK
jgi:hypothetical protein